MVDTKEKYFLTQLRDKKALLVTAHFDDEVLFAGGLLSILRNKIDIVCMTKTYTKRPFPEKDEQAFKQLCADLKINAYYGMFEPHKAHLSPERLPEYCYACWRKIRYLRRFKDYDIIITHNATGEYGHIDHVITHYACKVAFYKKKMYAFGTNLQNAEITVNYDYNEKKRLVDYYADVWTPRGYPFCYQPETYKIIGKEDI